MKLKLREADRLSRKGQADEACFLYQEVRRWAEDMNILAEVQGAGGDSWRTTRFASLMPPVDHNSGRCHLQAAIEASLLRAETASAVRGTRGHLWQAADACG